MFIADGIHSEQNCDIFTYPDILYFDDEDSEQRHEEFVVQSYLIEGLKWLSLQAGRHAGDFPDDFDDEDLTLIEDGFWWAYMKLLIYKTLPQSVRENYHIILIHVSGHGFKLSFPSSTQ